MGIREHISHPFPAVYDNNSQILILGSFPSVKSREQNFFYGHPQNRFWQVTASIFGCAVPQTTEEKRAFLIANGIAVWDVIASCEIEGSADSKIKNSVPNDIAPILESSQISAIFTNGATAHKLYEKYIEPKTGIPAVKLPSTSPANAAWSVQKLINTWKIIKKENIK